MLAIDSTLMCLADLLQTFRLPRDQVLSGVLQMFGTNRQDWNRSGGLGHQTSVTVFDFLFYH